MRSEKHSRISVGLGNTTCVLGTTVGVGLLFSAMSFSRGISAFIVSVVGLTVLYYFTHCLAHYAIGRPLGIRFLHYEIGRSSIRRLNIRMVNILADRLPMLTLRINFNASPKSAPLRFFVMHSAGSIASMLVPALGSYFVWWSFEQPLRLLLLLGNIGNVGFELYSSPKAGDLHRAFATYVKLKQES